jgi:hypothetical protein
MNHTITIRQPIPIQKTPRYIASCKVIEEYRNNQKLTGLCQLIAPGPRDWLKNGETWDDLHRETYNYYYENGLVCDEELIKTENTKNNKQNIRCWLKGETWDEYVECMIKM